MADVAWLLLMFFLLTGELRGPEKHPVDLPGGRFCIDCGQLVDLGVRIQANGRMWIWLAPELRDAVMPKSDPQSNNPAQAAILEEIKAQYEWGFGPQAKFRTLKSLLQAQQDGVTDPKDIVEWAALVKKHFLNPRIFIRADRNTPYPVIEEVFSAFQQVHVNRFSLVTRLEMEER